MQKGFLASLLAVALLVGTAGAAVKLTGIEYTYPQMPNQDPEITQQDPALEKLADGRVGIGAPGAVWVAWNHPQAMVLFDLGELPSQYLTLQREFYFKYNQAFGFLISYVYGTHTHSSYCEDNNLSSLRPSQSLFHYQIEQR